MLAEKEKLMATSDHHRPVQALRVLAFLALLTIVYFAGVATERMRFDKERSAVIKKYEKVLADWRNQQMQSEKQNGK